MDSIKVNTERPEGVSEEQMAHLMAHLAKNPAPKVTATESGTIETRMLYSPEELQARRERRRNA